MFKNELANNERYFKGSDDVLQLDTSITIYEAFVELGRDKEGNPLKNKDGSDRYFPIDDSNIVTLKEDVEVKKVRDDLFKGIYEVNGDKVEKVERDGKRIYYVVEPEKITTLSKGTKVTLSKSGLYRLVNLPGMIVVDDTDMEKERVVMVKLFKTDDHKKEAEAFAKEFHYRHHRD